MAYSVNIGLKDFQKKTHFLVEEFSDGLEEVRLFYIRYSYLNSLVLGQSKNNVFV